MVCLLDLCPHGQQRRFEARNFNEPAPRLTPVMFARPKALRTGSRSQLSNTHGCTEGPLVCTSRLFAARAPCAPRFPFWHREGGQPREGAPSPRVETPPRMRAREGNHAQDVNLSLVSSRASSPDDAASRSLSLANRSGSHGEGAFFFLFSACGVIDAHRHRRQCRRDASMRPGPLRSRCHRHTSPRHRWGRPARREAPRRSSDRCLVSSSEPLALVSLAWVLLLPP